MLKIIVSIFVFASACFSQQMNTSKDESLKKGEEIVRKAREAAGFSAAMDSFQINYHHLSTTKGLGREINMEAQIETTVSSNKIRALLLDKDGSITQIWNGKKYRETAESIGYDGQRRIVDMTNGISLSQNAVNALKYKNPNVKIPISDEAARKTAGFNSEMWTMAFPFILMHPIESSPKFEYVGRAQAGEEIAAVVQTKTVSGEILRLFFDEKTNNLLLIIRNRKNGNKGFEDKYYCTNREKRNGILIPTKIKVESKEVPAGQSSIVSYEIWYLTDFQINPNVKPNIFNIN